MSKYSFIVSAICTNPPYGLEEYIQRDFIYWLEGNSDDEIWKEQLYDYLKRLNSKDGLEIWSIWFGDGPQDIKEIKLELWVTPYKKVESDVGASEVVLLE